MILDLSQFGSGVGLVMVGWLSGMVVSVIFSTVRKL